jgi:hypothetical protein
MEFLLASGVKRRFIMSKKSLPRSPLFVAAIVLLSASLACVPTPMSRLDEEMLRELDATRTAFAATEQAQTHATQTARPDEATRQVELTKIASMSEEEVEATLYAEEACIVKEGEAYSWEYTGFKIEEGPYATSCQYNFVIRNTSDEDQTLILYERSTTGETKGMTWEKWNVRHFSAHDSYDYHFSYTKYDKGDDTWYYATKLLIVRGIPECHWLIRADDPKNLDIWEAYATPLENPCR